MSDPGLGRPVWYRSLYGRIALGFILCVACVLLAQGALFLWLASRSSAALIRSPHDLAALAGSALSSALETDSALDIGTHLTSQYGRSTHGVIVLMADGRVYRNRPVDAPPQLLRMAVARLRREVREGPLAESLDSGPDPDGPPFPPGVQRRLAPQGERMRMRRPAFGRVVVEGAVVGLTVVLPGPPGPFPLLAEYGPTLAAAGAGLLLFGTATMAFVVFRPVRRRLQAIEEAAAAVGGGDTSARAPEHGGDEVAALARRFNRMAEDLDARVRDLEEVDRSRRQLLADVSHELMTPLTAMRGYLETLALPRAVPDAATRERYLRIVTEETLRLEAIIGDLLDLARLESGGGDLQRGSVDVGHLFARAAERHEPMLRDKGIVLDVHVAPDATGVSGDERRLEQALQNLVANAVRHTPRDGRIRLDARLDGDRVRLAVEDSGPGIPPAHLARVFDRFYRVDEARDQGSGGSGLGLSIVRAVVERHGGSVHVANVTGGGARFESSSNRDGRPNQSGPDDESGGVREAGPVGAA